MRSTNVGVEEGRLPELVDMVEGDGEVGVGDQADVGRARVSALELTPLSPRLLTPSKRPLYRNGEQDHNTLVVSRVALDLEYFDVLPVASSRDLGWARALESSGWLRSWFESGPDPSF